MTRGAAAFDEAVDPTSNGRHRGGGTTRPQIVPMADVVPEKLQWYWQDRFPLGKVNMLIGLPDCGKTLLALDMMARTSIGKAWPDDKPNLRGGAVIMTSEDGLADTIRPRLDAAGADVSRIVALEGRVDDEGRALPFTLRNVETIAEAIDSVPECRLVVIDPLLGYMGDAESNSNTEMRDVLRPLSQLAEVKRVCILGINHLRKAGDAAAIHRSLGATAIAATARSVWCVTVDPADPTGLRRLMLRIKCNLAANVGGLAYRPICPEGYDAPALSWEQEPVQTRIEDVFAAGSNRREDDSDVDSWLGTYLADGGKPVKEVFTDGKEQGFGKYKLRAASRRLGVRTERCGFGGGFKWELPASRARVPNLHHSIDTNEDHSFQSFQSSQSFTGVTNGEDGPDAPY